MVAGWYDLLTLFPAAAEKRRIVADQDNHGDVVAELRQDLLDEPRVDLVEANVDLCKRPVTRRKVPCFGELALRVWVREFHRVLTPHPKSVPSVNGAERISDIEGKVARVSARELGNDRVSN